MVQFIKNTMKAHKTYEKLYFKCRWFSNIIKEEGTMRKRYYIINSDHVNDSIQIYSRELQMECYRASLLPVISNRSPRDSVLEQKEQQVKNLRQQVQDLTHRLDKVKRTQVRQQVRPIKRPKKVANVDIQTSDQHLKSIAEFGMVTQTPQPSFHNMGSVQAKSLTKVSSSMHSKLTKAQISSQKMASIPTVSDHSKQSIKSLKKVVKQYQKKGPKRDLRNIFRKCVYAVYFCLYLPALTSKIYKNRIKEQMKEYPYEVKLYLPNTQKKSQKFKFKQDQKDLWNQLLKKNHIVKRIQQEKLQNCLRDREAIKKMKNNLFSIIKGEVDSSDAGTAKEFNTFQEQIVYQKNQQQIVPKIQSILQQCFATLNELINSGFMDTRWKTFSMGLMNDSFVNNSHPKIKRQILQTGQVKLHPTRETLIIPKERTEELLLAFDIVCRFTGFRWLNHLEFSDGLYSPKTMIISMFVMSLLCLLCQSLLAATLGQKAKSEALISQTQKDRTKRIRPIVPLLVYTTKRTSQLIETDLLIADLPLRPQAELILNKNPEFVQAIKKQFLKLGKAMREKFRSFMKADHKRIFDRSIKQQNLIFEYRMKPIVERGQNRESFKKIRKSEPKKQERPQYSIKPLERRKIKRASKGSSKKMQTLPSMR